MKAQISLKDLILILIILVACTYMVLTSIQLRYDVKAAKLEAQVSTNTANIQTIWNAVQPLLQQRPTIQPPAKIQSEK